MPQESYIPESMKPNGELEVYLFKNSQWVMVESLPFDKYLREGAINLDGFITASQTVKVRLAKKGGGSAHLDSVFLGGSPPAAVCGVQGDVLGKLSQKDYDVISVGGDGIEIEFPQAGKDRILSVTARIENMVISQIPFQFPSLNNYQQITKNSAFYTYRLNSRRGSINLDGIINEVSSSEAFYKEYVYPGSGHPPGYTYGWVLNDDNYLYVAIDFTPDNTMDGEKDYSKVYVDTPEGVKEFKVSVPETTWGNPGFTYTDKVVYQHKVYEFAIPLEELGVGANSVTEIKLAFSAYGTAALPPGSFKPSLAFDSLSNKYLSVYEKNIDYDTYIYGELVGPDGTPSGTEIEYSGAWGGNNPSVACGVYGDDSRYLVVWEENLIYGRLVDADNGSPIGDPISISDPEKAIISSPPSVAYDSDKKRFLVVWGDQRYPDDIELDRTNDIYGQFIKFDGTPDNENFIICNAGAYDDQFNLSNQTNPSVAYDSVNKRFLAVWEDERNWGYMDIYGQLLDSNGTLVEIIDGEPIAGDTNINFLVSDGAENKFNPALAYDSDSQNFLVAWQQGPSGSENIYGQLVNADGSLTGTGSSVNFPISTAVNQQTEPVVMFNEGDNILVLWSDRRNDVNTNGDIYGQEVSSGGSLYPVSGESLSNMSIAALESDEISPGLAYNQQNDSFLVAFTASDQMAYQMMPPPPAEFTVNNYSVSNDPYAITAGDLNSDGNTDLIVSDKTDGNGGFSVLMGNGDGTFAESVFNGPFGMVFWPAVGLFDSDANPDLAVTSPYAGLRLFKGTGSGTFSTEPYATYYNSGLNSVVAGNFNGDGLADLAVSDANNKVLFYINNGNGTFGGAEGIPNSAVDIRMPTRMAAGDINNDGADDLAVMYDDYLDGDSVYILLNNGAGNFSWSDNFPSMTDSLWESNDITIGDADGDGNEDILVANMSKSNPIGSGRASVFRGRGDGTFDAMTYLLTGGGPVGIAVKDFNGDGNNDVAVANRYSGTVSVLCGNGLGGFAAKQDFSVGTSPFYMTADDFDNDTEMDLAVVNNDGDSISVLLSGTAIPDTQAPLASLKTPEGGSYTVIIRAGAVNSAEGVPLAEDYTFTFTVQGPEMR